MRNQVAPTQSPILRVAIPGPWNTIHPGLQHSLYGDLVLSNQFEALVGLNDNGVSVPLGASSWTISDDFTVFRFQVDTSKTFPDGTHLTAYDYKWSWENAARLEPISANNSLLDVLYKIKGFNSFKDLGTIDGLKVIDERVLEIHFSSPFRMALEHLQGNRFAAYKEIEGRFLGTGVFVIEELEQHRILMHPRADLNLQNIPTLEVKFIPAGEIVNTLVAGDVDVIFYLAGDAPQVDRLQSPQIKVLAGLDSLHLSIGLNGTKSSLFSKVENRQALLFLVNEAIKQDSSLLPARGLFDIDSQFYMPLQAGRIDQEEARSIADTGKQYVEQFLNATKQRPLLVKLQRPGGRVLDLLKKTGIAISSESGPISSKEFFETIYAANGPDLLVAGFSVASGDPDGLYHVLGVNGAIRSPWIYSSRVGDLLEEGRKIADASKLDTHYQNVSRVLLQEVPYIHLGFSKAIIAYQKGRASIDTTVLRRNQGQMHFLRASQ